MSCRPHRVARVRVHNLKSIDLDIPQQKLIVLCGLSGSGKSSLALDTLYAEGQRRYIESFSAYTRQFLQRLEKPDAELIDNIPPAIAVTQQERRPIEPLDRGHGDRGGRLPAAAVCQDRPRDSLPQLRTARSAATRRRARRAARRPAARESVAWSPSRVDPAGNERRAAVAAALREEGFVARSLTAGCWTSTPIRQVPLLGEGRGAGTVRRLRLPAANGRIYVILDRLAAGGAAEERARDSLETAFSKGDGRCLFSWRMRGRKQRRGRVPLRRPSPGSGGRCQRLPGSPQPGTRGHLH